MALIEEVDDRPRAVVLRALGLGDTLTAVPALRGLVRALPDLRLTVVMPAPLAPLLELAGVPCDVLPRNGFHDPTPAGTAPVAVNLHGRGPQSHQWLAGLRPARWVAFADPATGVAGPGWRDDEHERGRWCRLVSTELGVETDPDDVTFPAVRHQHHRAGPDYAVVHPGAASAARRWPPERFAAVVRHLLDRGLEVVLTGSGAEDALLDRVLALSGGGPSVIRSGPTDVRRLAHLVAGARVLTCGDTGVAHLASATGTPSVVLFGPTSPQTWGPPASGPHRVLWHGRTGDPHADTVDPGLLEISVDEVAAELDGLLAAEFRPGRRAPTGSPGGTTDRRSASPAVSPAGPPPGPR